MVTLNLQVGASSDDAKQAADTTMSLTIVFIRILGPAQWGGIRFTNVTIPQGATINTATITVDVEDTVNDDPNENIYGNDVDNAGTFTSTNSDISGRARTTAVVEWTATGVGAGTEVSPDISTVIQEIVNRAGWVSGNAIALIFDHLGTTNFAFTSYDGSTTLAAKLDITYTVSGAVAKRKHQVFIT